MHGRRAHRHEVPDRRLRPVGAQSATQIDERPLEALDRLILAVPGLLG